MSSFHMSFHNPFMVAFVITIWTMMYHFLEMLFSQVGEINWQEQWKVHLFIHIQIFLLLIYQEKEQGLMTPSKFVHNNMNNYSNNSLSKTSPIALKVQEILKHWWVMTHSILATVIGYDKAFNMCFYTQHNIIFFYHLFFTNSK